jgi:membrane fusion protein (multidrug efflux system)
MNPRGGRSRRAVPRWRRPRWALGSGGSGGCTIATQLYHVACSVAGVIARKRLEVGQVVQARRPFLAVVPLHRLWVEANFKETQLQRMRPGQKATLHADAYPDQVFTDTIESLSPGTGSVFSL